MQGCDVSPAPAFRFVRVQFAVPSPELDALCINTIRALSMDAVQKANSGHPGMPMGAAPMAHALWSRHLNFNPKNPNWFNRDRFVLSAGHGSMLLYSLLHLTGFEVSLDEIKRFRQLGSITPGHPEVGLTPGVEMATGPLGQGFATAVGMAIAERFLAATFNQPEHEIVDHFTYVIASDGDLMEGISNEAASLAGHQKLGKLIVLYDDNQITIDGSTSLSFSEDVGARFEALGWHVQKIDGMDVEAVDVALEKGKRTQDKPSLICAKTTIGFGSPNKAGTSKSHGAPLGVQEVKLAKEVLGIPVDEDFWRAPEAVEFYGSFSQKGVDLESDWNQQFSKFEVAIPELASKLKDAISSDIPIPIAWPTFSEAIQTRQAGWKCIQKIAHAMPTFLGGSADLAESNNTLIEGTSPMSAADPDGRNIYFGIREHAMAAATNGMNLHGGMKAFCATFLIFSDYCRPSIRLAALMHCPTVFVFTHDSIGVGEDGPTHQPIEHYMSLRAIPNLNFMRPADGNETAACWAVALESEETPSVLALTRQAVQSLTPNDIENHPARQGGYVLKEAENELQVVLVATGSEVALACEARKLLESQGIGTRVVSLPSWFLFGHQTNEYQESVLSSDIPTVSIEMGATLGWQKYASHHVGLDTFGESAPLKDLLVHFGFTAERVAEVARVAILGVRPTMSAL